MANFPLIRITADLDLERTETLRRRLRHASFLVAWVAFSAYLYLLFTFHHVDYYHQHFFRHGTRVTYYLVARLFFILFLTWLIYAPGVGLLTIIRRNRSWNLPLWERYPLGFLVGAGLWNVILLAMGLVGLYRKPLMVSMTVSVLALSVPHMAACFRELAISISRLRNWQRKRLVLAAAATLTFMSVSVVFVLVKGLYPAGGHDYYTHYFSFYRRVVLAGSILPNEVWYHFYYSKGAGLFFLGMLLTDALAPSLITTCFIAVGACLVFAILRRGTQSNALGSIGAMLFITLLIYTPGPDLNRRMGGWGDLEKHHEVTAVLILGVVWIMSRVASTQRSSRTWLTALCACIVSIGLITLSLLFLIGLYATGIAVWLAWRRQWHEAMHALIACCVAALTIAAVLMINQYYTGLALENGILYAWPFANLRKISDWGVTFEVIRTHLAYTGIAGGPWDWNVVGPLLFTSLRLELWWPLLLASVPLIIWRLAYGRTRRVMRSRLDRSVCGSLLWFSGATIIAVVLEGRFQPISFYRLTSFSYGITLCLALMLWWVVWPENWTGKWRQLAAVVVGIAMSALAVDRFTTDTIRLTQNNVRALLIEAVKLWTGQFSLRDAYQHQEGWPGRLPWGGIYPPMEIVWRLVPRDTRIISFHIHSYCMLPDCNVETIAAFRFSRQWQTVYFDTAEHAARVLQREGANYFFFSKELPLFSSLPAAPIFSAGHIGEYLGVKWSDGTSYLLTWLGDGAEPLDSRFLEAYGNAVAHAAGGYNEFIAYRSDWMAVANYLTTQGKDVQPFFLPWCRTCAGLPRTMIGSVAYQARSSELCGGEILAGCNH